MEQRQSHPATVIDYSNEESNPALRLVAGEQSQLMEQPVPLIMQNINEGNFVQPGSETSIARLSSAAAISITKSYHVDETSHYRLTAALLTVMAE